MSRKGDQESYELHLPVYKQGDDLAAHLRDFPHEPAKAFVGLAERYEAAAAACRRVAGVIAEAPLGIAVQADTHMICVEGPRGALAGLVADKVLTKSPFEEEEEGEEEGS